MEQIFEELDYQSTPFGEISLRRRTEPRLDNKLIYEVKLGDEFLMSSLFVEAEEQLSKLGLAQLKENDLIDNLDIVVGGLGLGYTALSVLNDTSVKTLRTIDVMQPVINWHQQGILPIGDILETDSRSTLRHGDFFAIATASGSGFNAEGPLDDKPVHAVLLDIDHSPSHWLKESNRSFYSVDSLSVMATKIVSGGVFGLWSNDLPDEKFIQLLNSVFASTQAHVVRFPNPYSGGESTNSVYICTVS